MIEYTPTKAPYALERSTRHRQWKTYFDDQTHAMWQLVRNTPSGVDAELRDADGVFIAGCSSSHTES